MYAHECLHGDLSYGRRVPVDPVLSRFRIVCSEQLHMLPKNPNQHWRAGYTVQNQGTGHVWALDINHFGLFAWTCVCMREFALALQFTGVGIGFRLVVITMSEFVPLVHLTYFQRLGLESSGMDFSAYIHVSGRRRDRTQGFQW